MSGSKVGLCTVNESSSVTMITEDGVIAEMIIEVDDDNQLEAHEPFNFELDEDEDCIEVYSSGFPSSRNSNTGQISSRNWMCNGDIQFGVNVAGGQKEVTPGLRDLNLLVEPVAKRPRVPIIGSVPSSEKANDCIVINDPSAKKPRKKYGKKLPPPKSSMVTRGKAAANHISVDVPKETISDRTPKEDTVGVAMGSTNDKDAANSISDDITSNVISDKCGDSDPSLMDVPKETSNGALTNEVPEDVSKEPSDAPKETTGSTTLDLESKLGSSTVQSGEKVAPVSSSEEKVASVSSSEEKVASVSSSEEKVAPVSSSEEKVALVSSSEEKVAPVSSSEEKVAPVSSSEEKIAPVSLSEEKIAPVSLSEEKVAPVSLSEEKIAPVRLSEEKVAPVCSSGEKVAAVCSAGEKVAPVCSAGEKVAPVSSSGEKAAPVGSATPDIKAKSSHEHYEKNSSASKVDEINSISHKTDEDKVIDEDNSAAEQQSIHGCGEKLGDISLIQQAIQNTTRRLGLRALYKLIYGFRVPKDMEIVKERVMQFSGFPFEENSIDFERKMKALKGFPDVARKQICYILGIAISSKTDTDHGILKFLLKPKCQNSQYMGACYQPVVLLERLPEALLKCQTVGGSLVPLRMPAKKESPVKKYKKRKAAVENSEVRLTRSAKRLMEHKEEEEKAEEMENSVALHSSDALEEKSCKLKKDENKSHECEVPIKSRSDEKVKVRKEGVSLCCNSDTDTDECLEENLKQAFPDSSDGEAGSAKGTLGRRLGDFWKIRKNVEKADKESLQALHTILYDNYSNYDNPENWKKNILRFSGFNFKCVSNKWKRKEFILSLMPPSKLKCIADMLHLQYYSPKSQKPLVLNIMKFLSEPRDGMLKHSNFKAHRLLKHSDFSQKRRKRRKLFNAARQQDKQAALDEEDTALEVEALLQDIRKKRHSDLLEDSSAESDMLDQNSFTESKKKKLGNIPNVQFMIITSNYEDIDNLHQLLFLQSGPRAKIRRNVQNFEGFTFGPGSFSYKIRIKLLNKMGYEVAKRIAFFLGLASLGTTIPQQDLNELIMHFLMCPSDIKCKSIKAYPKNFFNNNPTERPVVDITSITDSMKNTIKVEKKLAKVRDHHKEKSEEMKRECEASEVEFDVLKDGTKKVIKVEKDAPQNDSSESFAAETVMGSDANVSLSCEESRVKNVDDDQKVKTRMQNQKDSEMPLSLPRPIRKRKSAKKKLNVPCIGKKKRTVLKKENNHTGMNTVESEVDDIPKKQFLFRFDTDSKFDSKKIFEYLNRESQKSVMKEVEVPKTEVTDPVQTAVPNVPVKITAKPEFPGSPKVISILLPPPSQSPQKNISVNSDLNNKTNSSASNTDCVTPLQNVSASSSTASVRPEGKLPIPPLPKKQVINFTPQSLQNLQPRAPSTNVTQIKVPSSLLESMKGSQIEGVIRLPQNFVAGQNSAQASSSGTMASDVLSLPEVQKCLQQINNANGKKKQVQMIKIPGNNSVALQPGSLNMSGGKVYVIPVKPGSQQFSSLPISSVVTPIQLNNHFVIPSSAESRTQVNIPQLIQVAKNYSRTVGTTAMPVNNVTIAKVKPDFVRPVSFPTVPAGQCLFPISVTPNSNLVSLPVVKVQNTLLKEPSPASEPPFVVKTDKVDAEKSKQNQNLQQQKEDNNSDSELDEEPLSHLVGHPSDDMLIQNIREIVIGADLSSITMRNVLQKVFDKYPQFDLTYRKSFLKDAVKKVICCTPPTRMT